MKSNPYYVLLLGVIALAGCSSTGFVSTWKEPLDGPIDFKGKRVAAIVLSKDEGTRRVAEDTLAREISKRGAQGTAGYLLVRGENDTANVEDAKRKLREANIQGAVVMRAVSSEQEVSYSPGTAWYSGAYYGSFWGYWGYGWPMVYDPGYLRTDTIVHVETLVYSVEGDKLLWAGRSKTTNPSKVKEFIQELSTAAAKEMRKAGFIE
ncbi:MAG TPA: hypothetical protein VLK65_21010 [Vicinamibacteria bacterium]|nr:hypothetical protein [Vicinamibacteria bacterium]